MSFRSVVVLTSEGDDTLKILDVKKCCGAVINLEKKELRPGERGVLTVQYHVGRASGTFKKQIGLLTNDPQNALVELTITGEIVQTLAWTPARFEIAPYKANVPCPEITIRSLDGMPFSIKGFAATGQCLTGEFDPSRKATEFTLKPNVDVAKVNTLTTSNGAVRIDLDHPDYKTITVGFSVVPALQAAPPQLLVFNARAGESVVRSLQVQDNEADPNSGAAVPVESVSCRNGSRAELRGVTAGRTGCELKLEVWPAAGKGNESFCTDELLIKMKDGRELIVPVRVFYQVPALSEATSPGT